MRMSTQSGSTLEMLGGGGKRGDGTRATALNKASFVCEQATSAAFGWHVWLH
jgi:hypothetical protein